MKEEYNIIFDENSKFKLITQDDFEEIHKLDNFTTKLGGIYEIGVQALFQKHFQNGKLNNKLLDPYFYFEDHSHQELEKYINSYMNNNKMTNFDDRKFGTLSMPNDLPSNVSENRTNKEVKKTENEKNVYVEVDYEYFDKIDPNTQKNEQMVERFFKMLRKDYPFTLDICLGTNESQNHELIVEVKHCLSKFSWNEFISKAFPKVLRIYKFNQRLFRNYKLTLMLVYNYGFVSTESFEEGEFLKFNTKPENQKDEIKGFKDKLTRFKEMLNYYSIDFKVFYIADTFLSYSYSSSIVKFEEDIQRRQKKYEEEEKQREEDKKQREEDKRQREEDKRQREEDTKTREKKYEEEKRQREEDVIRYEEKLNEINRLLIKLQEENELLKKLK